MNIWIMESDSGVTLLFQSYKELFVNEDLVSGLLTALNQFTVFEFKQGIESIEMGGLRWVYLEAKEVNLLFIAADTKEVSSDIIKARLNVIKQTFVQRYFKDKKKDWKNSWDGNTEIFKDFKNTIDEYYDQWKQAEDITTIAEFFDILGIFQQILNLMMNAVSRTKAQNKINSNIEEMFENLIQSSTFQKEEELQKISFSQEAGFNIISINPSNCDMMLVERELIHLISNSVAIIKNEIGREKSVKCFLEENIYNYLINNLSLLKELNLEKFLLQLFLK